MAKNMIYKYTENKTRVRTLVAALDSGAPLLDPADARPAVTITAVGQGIPKTYTSTDSPQLVPFGGGVTSVTVTEKPASLFGLEATLAYDGTWALPVAAAPTSTAQGTQVYITAATNVLTLTSAGNVAYGRVDYPTDYSKVVGILPIRLGV